MQTYKEILDIIIKDLRRFKEFYGIESLKEIDVHRCFYIRKKNHPEKYERLDFSDSFGEPFSKNLEEIFSDLRICGILKVKYDLIQ